MRLVSQLIFLYDLIFDVVIVHIIFLLILCIRLLLTALHFSCLEKLKLMLKLIFSFNISNVSSVHTKCHVLFFS